MIVIYNPYRRADLEKRYEYQLLGNAKSVTFHKIIGLKKEKADTIAVPAAR